MARLHKSLINTHIIIILTKARRTMHNTRTLLISHKLSSHHRETILRLHLREILKQWHISLSLKRTTFEGLKNLKLLNVSLFENVIDSCLKHNESSLLVFIEHLDVIKVGVNSESQVAGEGPRGGGPGHEADSRVFFEGEGHYDGGVVDCSVV